MDISNVLKLRAKALTLPAITYKFIFATSFELRKTYNGIGAEWMPKWLRWLVTSVFHYFEPAALVHDFCFAEKEKSFIRFTIHNLFLFINMLYLSPKKRSYIWAFLFALVCQCFGWKAYKDAGVK